MCASMSMCAHMWIYVHLFSFVALEKGERRLCAEPAVMPRDMFLTFCLLQLSCHASSALEIILPGTEEWLSPSVTTASLTLQMLRTVKASFTGITGNGTDRASVCVCVWHCYLNQAVLRATLTKAATERVKKAKLKWRIKNGLLGP